MLSRRCLLSRILASAPGRVPYRVLVIAVTVNVFAAQVVIFLRCDSAIVWLQLHIIQIGSVFGTGT